MIKKDDKFEIIDVVKSFFVSTTFPSITLQKTGYLSLEDYAKKKGMKGIEDLECGDKVRVIYGKGDSLVNTYRQVHEITIITSAKEERTLTEKAEGCFYGQEIIDKIPQEDRAAVADILIECVKCSTEIHKVAMTYEDTRKDTEEIAVSIMKVAINLSLLVDVNSRQILKKATDAVEASAAK